MNIVMQKLFMIQERLENNQSGFVMLLTALIVGAVGVAIATSLLLLGLSSSRTSFVLEQSNQAKALANSCIEEGLERIRLVSNFTGTNTIVLGRGSCRYTVTSQGGQRRTVTAVGTVDLVTRKVTVSLDRITAPMRLTVWQEVADL